MHSTILTGQSVTEEELRRLTSMLTSAFTKFDLASRRTRDRNLAGALWSTRNEVAELLFRPRDGQAVMDNDNAFPDRANVWALYPSTAAERNAHAANGRG